MLDITIASAHDVCLSIIVNISDFPSLEWDNYINMNSIKATVVLSSVIFVFPCVNTLVFEHNHFCISFAIFSQIYDFGNYALIIFAPGCAASRDFFRKDGGMMSLLFLISGSFPSCSSYFCFNMMSSRLHVRT